jgi:hypothetical protein
MKTTSIIVLFLGVASSVFAVPTTTETQADSTLVTRADDATTINWTGDSLVSLPFIASSTNGH